MSCLVARYASPRKYFALAIFALGGTVLAGWTALRWAPNWIAAGLFALSALVVFLLAIRPAVEIHETHLMVGRKAIDWSDIRRVDQTGWSTPLAVHLTLAGGERLLIVYPGDSISSANLLRQLRRCAHEALLDGVPYRQFWGEPLAMELKQLPPPRYPLLRPEDEDEVERMYQRLRSVGHLDPRGSDEQ